MKSGNAVNSEQEQKHTAHNLNVLDSKAIEIIGRYEQKRAATLPLLHLVQDHVGYIPPEGEAWVGAHVETSVAHVREVVSFYTLFRRAPIGKYHVQVCANMSCWLQGCNAMVRYLEEQLGIRVGKTTADQKFSLSTVECLCACEQAPMLQLNTQYVGPLSKARIDQMLGECP